MARVLVIDDEDLLRETLREILEDAGHDVCERPDGSAGIECFRQTPVDLVITDMIMPNMDGINTIWRLKQMSPDVRIIAISGGVPGGPRSDLPRAEMYGAKRTLQKPFTRTELLRAVDDVLA
jgi:CheY-like chemotaxis protein